MIEVQILFFQGCPNHEPAVRLAREVLAELDLEAKLEEILVESPADAERLRFLGSPSIRVNGRDIEPDEDHRTDFALSCRMYESDGLPRRKWMVAALTNTRE
jgi:hypothetical protein